MAFLALLVVVQLSTLAPEERADVRIHPFRLANDRTMANLYKELGDIRKDQTAKAGPPNVKHPRFLASPALRIIFMHLTKAVKPRPPTQDAFHYKLHNYGVTKA